MKRPRQQWVVGREAFCVSMWCLIEILSWLLCQYYYMTPGIRSGERLAVVYARCAEYAACCGKALRNGIEKMLIKHWLDMVGVHISARETTSRNLCTRFGLTRWLCRSWRVTHGDHEPEEGLEGERESASSYDRCFCVGAAEVVLSRHVRSWKKIGIKLRWRDWLNPCQSHLAVRLGATYFSYSISRSPSFSLPIHERSIDRSLRRLQLILQLLDRNYATKAP